MTWIWILVAAAAIGAAVLWSRRPRPVAKLTLRQGSGPGPEFLIQGRESTIGSEESRTVVVSHPKVSGLHATLTLEADGRFVLRDSSKRGTKVNGRDITEKVLSSGDLIRLADSIDLIFTRLR